MSEALHTSNGMNKKIKISLLTILILFLFATTLKSVSHEGDTFFGNKVDKEPPKQEVEVNKTAVLTVGETKVSLDIANTEGNRIRGLSGREEILYYQGMIFVFPMDGIYSFWMKDMNFSLDIIWLDKDYKIVHLEKNISPETYPKSFIPEKKSRYVVELHSGFATTHNLVVGQSLSIENLY